MKKILVAILMLVVMCCVACGSDPVSHPDTFHPSIPDEPDVSDHDTEYEDTEIITGEVEPLTDGIYTFYNRETGAYLSYSDQSLTLSATPVNWNLRNTGVGKYNVYAFDTDFLLDIDNAYVAVGTTVKLWTNTGYDVQMWKVAGNANGTYSILYSGDNQYCLGFVDGRAQLQIREAGNGMQEWEAMDVTDTIPKNYLSYKSNGGIIELQMPLDILTVTSEARLLQWANELEQAYYTYYELTGFIPYEKIILEAYKPCEYFAYVTDNCNVIRYGNQYIYQEMENMAARNSDWNFGALHEMGHMFDSKRAWKFEAEVMTDIKVAYVLERNGVAAAPAEFPATDAFYGADIINAYGILGTDFSQNYDVYSVAKRFLEIKNDIGWEPFMQTYHYLQENHDSYANVSDYEKLENFVSLLSQYSGNDIKSYFSANEWSTIVNRVNQ